MRGRGLGWLSGIVILGLALRLLSVLVYGDYPVLFMDSDSWGYHRLACNLLAGNGYSWDTAPPYHPNLYRPPVLPVLLAGLYRLCGPSIIAGIVLQAFVAAATILFTHRLALALTRDDRLALAAAALLALDPVGIHYSNLLLTEVYTSCLVVLLLGSLVRYVDSRHAGWLFIGGLVLAVGIVTHPVLLFLPLSLVALPLALCLSGRTRQDGGADVRAARTDARQVALGLLTACVALLPAGAWIVRNARVGDFTGISSVTAVNLLKYKAAGVEAELHGSTREYERDRLTSAVEAGLPAEATPGEHFRRWQRAGTAILLQHPWVYARVHFRGMLVELLGPERDHTLRLLYGPAVLDAAGRYTDASIATAHRDHSAWPLELTRYGILAWQAVLLVLLVLGTLQLIRTRRWRLLAVLMAVPSYVLLLSGGPEASPRFRVLYLPVLAVLAALGFLQVIGWSRAIRESLGRIRSASTGDGQSLPSLVLPLQSRTPRLESRSSRKAARPQRETMEA
jgi:4-amino-4-deoxy-L-arabinose transferase-like glycosyltransferase